MPVRSPILPLESDREVPPLANLQSVSASLASAPPRLSFASFIESRPTLVPTRRGKVVGSHPAVREVFDVIGRVAASSCTVLVTGESGTGKELVVAALHEASPRRDAPLVTVNCGAIPENLIESELFGHAKGAFTGAHTSRRGHVALAEGGTLFLDEVGELPLAVQVKLLRLLQQREYQAVGDSRTMKCDIRIVAATNRDLEAEIAAGRFREDLYYRLDVIHVQLPPLRERGEDVALLATRFLRDAADRAKRADLVGFSPAAKAALAAYSWPGNIRELENAVERLVLLSRGPYVQESDLPKRIRDAVRPAVTPAPAAAMTPAIAAEADLTGDRAIDFRAAVEAFENGLIRQALAQTGWNKNKAAQLLGINRTTLVEMIKRKGI